MFSISLSPNRPSCRKFSSSSFAAARVGRKDERRDWSVNPSAAKGLIAGRGRVVIVGIGEVDLDEAFELEEGDDAEELPSTEGEEEESSSLESFEESVDSEGESSSAKFMELEEDEDEEDEREEGEEVVVAIGALLKRLVSPCDEISLIPRRAIGWLGSTLSLLILLWGKKGPVTSRAEWERFRCDSGGGGFIPSVSMLIDGLWRLKRWFWNTMWSQWVERLYMRLVCMFPESKFLSRVSSLHPIDKTGEPCFVACRSNAGWAYVAVRGEFAKTDRGCCC